MRCHKADATDGSFLRASPVADFWLRAYLTFVVAFLPPFCFLLQSLILPHSYSVPLGQRMFLRLSGRPFIPAPLFFFCFPSGRVLT